MRFAVIDYSPLFFKDIPVPPRRKGKFIQVRGDDTEYIVLSDPELTRYHANIAERFFLSMGITGKYNPKMDEYSVSVPGWSIVGGGVWSIDEIGRVLEFGGLSMAYGAFDPKGLKERIHADESYASYTVLINGA